MSDLVSIIIPAYNAEQYIEKSIKSCINQTYKNIEIIVVNDGSTDNTAEKIKELSLQDNRIKFISTKNGGVSKARNTGLENINGDFFAFLDADDLLLENAIETLISSMNATGADIVAGKNINTVDINNYIIPQNKEDAVAQVLTDMQPLKCALKDEYISYAAWGKLYRSAVFKELRFVEGRKVNEDSFYVFECFLKMPKLVAINDYIYVYNISQGSASRCGWSEKFLDILYFADRKTKLIAENCPELLELTYNLNIKANMSVLMNLCKTYDKKYREIEKKCIKYIIKNRAYFLPINKANKKWFFIIRHHLYPLYKLYYLRYMRKNEDK